ncbi:MAG: site-specific integrase [Candidatus Celaenobacter antarcticus]|nr:site-specific integrase [Candidatus Celaenobacter antarcticus]
MEQDILLLELIEQTKEILKKYGLKKKTMQMYQSYGFNPIKRYYDKLNQSIYSEELTWKFVIISRKQYEKGGINTTKFQCIRRTAVFLKQRHFNKEIVWRSLPHWTTTKLKFPFNELIKQYEQEKLDSGYCITTMRGYKPVIKHFLLYVESLQYQDLLLLTKKDITKYLPVLSENYSSVGDCLSVLRSFGNFLLRHNLINADLISVFQVSVPVRRKFAIGFTHEEANRIISAVNRSTTLGKRDYAILMLVKYTGLRAIDILYLKFAAIDWDKQELRIIQHKTGNELILPLTTNVCNAIADYILNGRPKSEIPYVFLRNRNPYMPLKSWSGHSIVKRNAAKIGITWTKEEHKGFHSFRRSLGNWMLEAEIPLDTIKEVLGHSDRNSTKPYIAAHLSGLLNCAISLQGIQTTREELL